MITTLSTSNRLHMIESIPSKEGKNAQNESRSTAFVAYATNSFGETVAKFYDKVSGKVITLDRSSLEDRARNIHRERRSADVSELALKNWPSTDEHGERVQSE
jgi:hypothetical protein